MLGKGNEPLSWQHRSEQARIDRLIEEEQKEQKEPYRYEDTAEYAFNEFWKCIEGKSSIFDEKEINTMEELFKLNQVTDDGVAVIELSEKRHDALFIATHPIIESDWKYLTVTGVRKRHGGCHSLHYVKDNAESSYICEWGDNGTTLVTDDVSRLKRFVREFLEYNGYYAD